MIKKTILTVLILLPLVSTYASGNIDTISNLKVDYNAPVKYKIALLKVECAKHFDVNSIKRILRLKEGQEIQVPSDDISLGLRRLYRQGIFSDVKLIADKVVGNKIYLTLKLKGLPRLMAVNFKGIKSSEIKKLEEKTASAKRNVITPNLKNKIKSIINNYYKDKGFHNVTVNFKEYKDPKNSDGVVMDININKRQVVKIQDIFIRGNKEVSDNKLKRAMKKTREQKLRYLFSSAKYSAKEFKKDRSRLIEKYNELGFRDAKIKDFKVKKISDTRVAIYLDIDEGKRYYFNNIQWVGNTVYPSDMLNRYLKINQGDTYNKKFLNERLNVKEDAVSNLYYNNGYLFSQLIPKEIVRGKDSIDLEISVIEGSQARINKIDIEGNHNTHENIIRRELYVYPGDLFSRAKLIRSIRELSNLKLFGNDPGAINPKIEPNQDNGTADVTFELQESEGRGQLEASGGYGGGTIVASLGVKTNNFSIRNFFNKKAWSYLGPMGDGQTLSLRVQTNGKYYSQYSFYFMEPWLGGKKPNALSVSGHMSSQTRLSNQYQISDIDPDKDQKFRVWGLNIGLGSRLKWPDNSFFLQHTISYQRYELSNWGGFYNFVDGSSNLLSFKTILGRRSIDNPIYTSSGSDFSLGLQFTMPYSWFDKKDYSKIKDTSQEKYNWIEFHKWTFKGKLYAPLTRNRKLVLYTGTEYGFLGYFNRYKRSPFEGFSVGGDGMSGYRSYGTDIVGVRGYENNSLTPVKNNARYTTGNLYGKMTMELRYPLSLSQTATIYVLGFAEAGNSWYDFEEFEPFNMYRSAGVGVRIFLPIFGMLGIDWGYGFDKVPGRPKASGGQFHFVLGQQF